MKAPACKAWLGFTADGSLAQVCAWCPDKVEAEAEAAALGLSVTHGICDACSEKELASVRGSVPPGLRARQSARDVTAESFDTGTAHVTSREHRLAAPGATAPAAVSTPTGAPARIDPSPRYVALAVLAEVCGVSEYRLQTRYVPAHWGSPAEVKYDGRRALVNIAPLPDLADELRADGRQAEAAKLERWWMEAAAGARVRDLISSQPSAGARLWYQKGQFE